MGAAGTERYARYSRKSALLFGPLQDQPLQLVVGQNDGPGLQLDPHRFPRGQGLRLAHHAMDGQDSLLGGEDEGPLALQHPQGSESQRIHAEGALVPVAGDDGGGSLGEGSPNLPVVGIEVLQFVRKLFQLVKDRREHHFDRFKQRKAVAVDQRFHDAVQILGIAAVLRQGGADHPGLVPQLANGVDFAVVSQEGERLNPEEVGEGVGRIPVVADGDRRPKLRAGQVMEVPSQQTGCTHHLVDRRAIAEGSRLDRQS